MSKSIKLVSFNIEYCASISKGYWQYLTRLWRYVLPHDTAAIHNIADIINRDKIDIATFMEMDGGSYRTRHNNYMSLLSYLTELRENVFYPVRHMWWGLTNQGNGIATRFEVLNADNIKLETNRLFGENRYLSVSKLNINGRIIYVLTTQLALGHNSRIKELQHVANVINSIKEPILFTGDLNTQNEKDLEILKTTRLKRIETTNTFPSWKPKRRIDYIFHSPEFEVVESYVLDSLKVSDHLPVVAEFKLIDNSKKKIIKNKMHKSKKISRKK
jgi:endonuclease/exonuclease/phosphatase family metal-dependent hydrolase